MKQIYLAVFLCFVFRFSANAQVTILLSKSNTVGGAQAGTYVVFADKLAKNNGQLGFTDGTVAGTTLLDTATASLQVQNQVTSASFNNQFYILLSDAAHGNELWVSDGTTAGTRILKDINPGTASASVYGSPDGSFPVIGNTTMYLAADDGVHGSELWKTDGTPAGTVLVKDINPGSGGSNIQFSSVTGSNYVGDTLYFSANDGTHGQELWRTDGTEAGTVLVADISPGSASTTFGTSFIGVNHILYFQANDNVNGVEPWRSDGTAGGTYMLDDINPGSGSSFNLNNSNFNALIFNNKLYFVADSKDPVNSYNPQIFTTDGTRAGTIAITNNNVNQGGLNAALFYGPNNAAFILNGKFYFSTARDGQSTTSIWSSDGTAANTQLFKIIHPNPAPNGGTNPLLNILLPTNSNNDSVIQHPFQGNKFFFIGDDGTHGAQLWVSDGTTANTKMLSINSKGNGIDTSNYGNNFSYFYTGGFLFFTGNDSTHGYEPWQSDGTVAGTKIIADIWTGAGSSNPGAMGIASGNKLIFYANDGAEINTYRLDSAVTALPLLLGNFTARLAGKSVVLNWNTLQEINTANFSIQRSTNANYFTTIGNVAAAGNSSIPKYYTYTDGTIFNTPVNEYFYRLKIEDRDGNISYSKINPVNIQQNTVLNISPNPVTNNLLINFDNTVSGKVYIKVTNAAGQVVLSQMQNNTGGQTVILPLGNFAAGAYFVEVQAGQSKWQKTIIKK